MVDKPSKKSVKVAKKAVERTKHLTHTALTQLGFDGCVANSVFVGCNSGTESLEGP